MNNIRERELSKYKPKINKQIVKNDIPPPSPTISELSVIDESKIENNQCKIEHNIDTIITMPQFISIKKTCLLCYKNLIIFMSFIALWIIVSRIEDMNHALNQISKLSQNI